MKKLRELFEKNYFENTYVGIEARNNKKGYGKLIHTLTYKPAGNEFAVIMSFPKMIEHLMTTKPDDIAFFGPPVTAYKKSWRFRLFVKNRHLEKYFNVED